MRVPKYPQHCRNVQLLVTIRTNLPEDDLIKRLNRDGAVYANVGGGNVDRGQYSYRFVKVEGKTKPGPEDRELFQHTGRSEP